MTIDQQLQSLSNSFAAAKKQSWFTNQFKDSNGELGRITELIQRVMLADCVRYTLSTFSGSTICEIGVAEGRATVVMAEVAKSFGSAILAVDPFIHGLQESSEQLYQEFLKNTELYPDTVYHLRDKSQSDNAVQAIIDFKPSLVYVDGLHTFSGALSDVRTAYEALPVGGLVVVDDTNRMKKDAGEAFQKAINDGLFRLIEIDPTVEDVLYTYKSWHYGVKL